MARRTAVTLLVALLAAAAAQLPQASAGAAGAAAADAAQSFVVTLAGGASAAAVEKQLNDKGARVLAAGPGFFAVDAASVGAAAARGGKEAAFVADRVSRSKEARARSRPLFCVCARARAALRGAAACYCGCLLWCAALGSLWAHCLTDGAAGPSSYPFRTCPHPQAAALSSIQGVAAAFADARAAGPDGAAAAAWGAQQAPGGGGGGGGSGMPPGGCAAGDRVLGGGPFPEVEPYYLKQVQATSEALKRAPAPSGRGVLVCVVDSGVDAAHPEFAGGPDQLDGCKEEDAEAPAGCPFKVCVVRAGALGRAL